jgi:hypothetical protein
MSAETPTERPLSCWDDEGGEKERAVFEERRMRGAEQRRVWTMQRMRNGEGDAHCALLSRARPAWQ